jgi:Leucine-rich repeat (LRR) protein
MADLSSNQLQDLPSVLFAKTSKLVNLNLSNNMISSLPEQFFVNISDISALDLSYNYFNDTNIGFLSSLTQLRSIYLSYNNLRDLDQSSFAFLPKLQFLDISHNTIYSLSPGTFPDVANRSFSLLCGNDEVCPVGSCLKACGYFSTCHVEFGSLDSRSLFFCTCLGDRSANDGPCECNAGFSGLDCTPGRYFGGLFVSANKALDCDKVSLASVGCRIEGRALFCADTDMIRLPCLNTSNLIEMLGVVNNLVLT